MPLASTEPISTQHAFVQQFFVKKFYTQPALPILFNHLPPILNLTTSTFEGKEKGTRKVRWETKRKTEQARGCKYGTSN
jgi:hypothetical protein